MIVPHRVKDRDRDREDIVGTTTTNNPFRKHDEPNTHRDKKGDDDASSSSSSEESSLLSSLNGGRDAVSLDEQCNDNNKLGNKRQRSEQTEQKANEPPPPVVIILDTLDRKWDDWERRFAERERLLLRMASSSSRKKNTAYWQQLRQRERAVQRQTLERLIQTEARDDAERAIFLQRLDKTYNADARQPRKTMPQRCYDGLVLACHSIVPAVLSLIIHCCAHVGIFDGLSTVVESVKSAVLVRLQKHDDGLSHFYDYALDLAVFFVGVLLLRLSSDLFWWLSDRKYDCVKFDLHNRRRLGCGDARLLVTVRERPLVRVTLFMTGFSLCYVATMVLLMQYCKKPFNQNDELLRHLPSLAQTRPPRQTLALVSYCSQTCQDEIERQGTSLSTGCWNITSLQCRILMFVSQVKWCMLSHHVDKLCRSDRACCIAPYF